MSGHEKSEQVMINCADHRNRDGDDDGDDHDVHDVHDGDRGDGGGGHGDDAHGDLDGGRDDHDVHGDDIRGDSGIQSNQSGVN